MTGDGGGVHAYIMDVRRCSLLLCFITEFSIELARAAYCGEGDKNRSLANERARFFFGVALLWRSATGPGPGLSDFAVARPAHALCRLSSTFIGVVGFGLNSIRNKKPRALNVEC